MGARVRCSSEDRHATELQPDSCQLGSYRHRAGLFRISRANRPDIWLSISPHGAAHSAKSRQQRVGTLQAMPCMHEVCSRLLPVHSWWCCLDAHSPSQDHGHQSRFTDGYFLSAAHNRNACGRSRDLFFERPAGGTPSTDVMACGTVDSENPSESEEMD